MTLFDDTFYYCAFEKRTLLTLSFLSAHTRARTHAHAHAHHQAWWWCFDE